jgi:hypothetical protein
MIELLQHIYAMVMTGCVALSTFVVEETVLIPGISLYDWFIMFRIILYLWAMYYAVRLLFDFIIRPGNGPRHVLLYWSVSALMWPSFLLVVGIVYLLSGMSINDIFIIPAIISVIAHRRVRKWLNTRRF